MSVERRCPTLGAGSDRRPRLSLVLQQRTQTERDRTQCNILPDGRCVVCVVTTRTIGLPHAIRRGEIRSARNNVRVMTMMMKMMKMMMLCTCRTIVQFTGVTQSIVHDSRRLHVLPLSFVFLPQ